MNRKRKKKLNGNVLFVPMLIKSTEGNAKFVNKEKDLKLNKNPKGKILNK